MYNRIAPKRDRLLRQNKRVQLKPPVAILRTPRVEPLFCKRLNRNSVVRITLIMHLKGFLFRQTVVTGTVILTYLEEGGKRGKELFKALETCIHFVTVCIALAQMWRRGSKCKFLIIPVYINIQLLQSLLLPRQ